MKIAKSLVPALGLAAAACVPTAPIPAAHAPRDGSELVLVASANGEQVYECRSREGREVDDFEWVFVAPRATLFDASGHVIGEHGAGPAWEALDGSRVVGTLVARSPAPREESIPWLLLSATSEGGSGLLSGVTSIQRVNTNGGTAPPIPCTRNWLHRQMRMHYTADYRFYGKRHIL